jgi:hypothetical protein
MRVLVWLAVLLLVVSGAVSAQESYTTADGILSVVLPAGWVASEDAAQMFITNRAGITANQLAAGDVAIAMLRPRLLSDLLGKTPTTPEESILALIPLAQQEGAEISAVSMSEYGAFPAASFTYTITASGYAAQFVVVQAGGEQVALQIVHAAGEAELYAEEIRMLILSLRVSERLPWSLSGAGKSSK